MAVCLLKCMSEPSLLQQPLAHARSALRSCSAESMAQVEGTAAKIPELSVGSVRRLAAAALRPEEAAGGPIRVQVLCRKPAREGSKDRRTALRISDSCHHILALLAEDIKDPQEGSVIELLEWSCGMHQGLQAVFVEDWDQTSTECLGILGQPVGVPLEAPQTSAFEAPIAPAAKRQPLCEKPRPVASPMRSQGQASFHRDTQSLASPHAVAAMMPASASLPVVPIAQLSSFMQRCRVMVRVLSKSEMKTFSNARGPGKLFSVDLMDAAGECVRAACFNSAADKYFGMLQIKKTYDINGASVKPGNPRWCRYPFELTIEDRGTSVVALPEDGSIPPMPYKFVPLASLGTSPAGSSCDVMGVAHSVEEPVSIATRNQGPRQRRQFLIVDNSQASVSVSLWGEKADIQFGVGSVIFIRNAKVSDFSGRSLDLNAGSFLEANPDDKRAFQLKAWYQGGGKNEPVRFMLTTGQSSARGRKRSLAEMQQEDGLLRLQSDGSEKAHTVHYHRVSPVTVTAVRNERAPFYWGCTQEVMGMDSKPRTCNKKVENGQCAGGHICPEPAARFNLNLTLSDATSSVRCRAFGEPAEMLADVPASEFAVLENERLTGSIHSEKTYTRIFSNMLRRWSLTLKCRKECFEGRERVQISVENCSPVDFVSEGKEMAAAVRHALGI